MGKKNRQICLILLIILIIWALALAFRALGAERVEYITLPPIPPKPHINQAKPPTLDEVRKFVRKEARKSGVNPNVAEHIVKRESGYCWRNGSYEPDMPGDSGISIGCWQFNLKAHPDISYECAANLACSTKLALAWILEGRATEWSTFRFCRQWYQDCSL